MSTETLLADLAAAVRQSAADVNQRMELIASRQETSLRGLAESIGADVGRILSRLETFGEKLNAGMDDGSATRLALRDAAAEIRASVIGVVDQLNTHRNLSASEAHPDI